MKANAVLWLRISYWTGAALDFVAGLMMLIPSLFDLMNQPADFQADLAYRYAMGMGAPLMFAWTVLLLWADRRPLERMDILPITLLVVAGEIAVQVWGIASGFVHFFPLLPSFIMQATLTFLYLFSYFNARKLR